MCHWAPCQWGAVGFLNRRERGLWDCGAEWEELGHWTKKRGRTWIMEWWRGRKSNGWNLEKERGLHPSPHYHGPLLWWLCVNTTSPPVWPTKQLSFNTQDQLLTHDGWQKCQIWLEMSEGKLIIMIFFFIGASCFSFILPCSLQSAFLLGLHSSIGVTVPRAPLSCVRS